MSPQVDAEVAELHGAMSEGFERIGNLTKRLQAAGTSAAPAAGQSGGEGHAQVTTSQVAPAKIAAIRNLESDFSALQETAFKIGHESQDNSELSQHPQMNNYIQSLREFRPRLEDMVRVLEKDLYSITGNQADKPKKRRKAARTIQGLAEEDIRASARKAVKSDNRAFRTKAMDMVSTFRERQLQMQDKQHDLRLAMDGPDWPKEDWPLSTRDANHVGEAEQMIQAALKELTAKIDQRGGLAGVHESGDESVLEQLVALSEMMSGYGELIDRHVVAVKKVYKGRGKKKRKGKTDDQGPASSGSLRDQLLGFGRGQGTQGQPFAWLRGDHGAQGAPAALQQPGSIAGFGATGPLGSLPPASFPPQASSNPSVGGVGGAASGLARLAGLSSSLGSLGGLGRQSGEL